MNPPTPKAKNKFQTVDDFDPQKVDDAKAEAASLITVSTFSDVLRSDAFRRPRRTFPTGIGQYDKLTAGGLKATQQSIWMAPTGVGKTSLVGTLALNLALAGHLVLWIMTELPAVEQAARLAAIRLRRERRTIYTPDDLLSHHVRPEDIEGALDGLPLYELRVRRRDGDPFPMVRAHMAAIAEKHGVAPIVVGDYAQKFAATDDAENRRISVAAVSDQFLGLAEDFDTHAALISSVSRAHYSAMARKARKQAGDEDPRDWLAAAKDAGELEYDAANVNFLDVADNADVLDERDARIIVAKCRNGGPGYVGMRFHGPSGLFIEAAESVEAMRPEARKEPGGRGVEELVVDYLRQHQVDPPTKDRLRVAIKGHGVQKVDRAIKALESEGAISFRETTYQTAGDKPKTRTRTVVALAEEKHAT